MTNPYDPATSRYPRDLIGHGASPPDPCWPNDAKLAVQIVLNYEEGGENCILHGDAASEAYLTEVVGMAHWPGQRNLSIESQYEYGSRAGFWRIHRLFTQRNIPLTVYGVTMALARNPDAAAAMVSRRSGRSPLTRCAGSTIATCRRRKSGARSPPRSRYTRP